MKLDFEAFAFKIDFELWFYYSPHFYNNVSKYKSINIQLTFDRS
jgi:hypothetical protein